MANLRAGLEAGDDAATGVGGLFQARYPEMVRLADLLGADDPEDIAQEAFARLIRRRAYFYGYTHENVRRVVLRLAGGKQYGAQTFAAWVGSGLRLWDFSVPARLRSSFASADILGYDAAGQVVWQKAFPAAAP